MMVSPEQNQAIICPGHCSIIAAPGAGKTRTLIAKTLALIKAGHTKVQLISFTNASAKEIEERIFSKLDKHLRSHVKVGTFHAVLLNQLSLYGVSKGFVTPQQQSSMLHQAWSSLISTGTNFKAFQDYVSQKLLWEHKPDTSELETSDDNSIYEEAFVLYRQLVLDSQQVTLDNLIPHCVDLMLTGKLPLLDANTMMVDEVQDVCNAQLKLILLHGLSSSIVTTVGDDDQSIYGWRGAKGVEAILTLEDVLSAKRITLSTNYRSYSEILSSAYELLASQKSRIPKTITADRGEGGSVIIKKLNTPEEEAFFIAGMIQKEPATETFIIARTNAYFIAIEKELKSRGIDFKRLQSKGYFDNSVCHLAMSASLSFFKNKGNEFDYLLKVLFAEHKPMVRSQVLSHDKDDPNYSKSLNLALFSIRASHQRFITGDKDGAIKLFLNGMVERLTDLEFIDAKRLYTLADTLEKLNVPTLEAKFRILTTPPKKKEGVTRVTLMTCHASKGLEANRVFVAGVNYGMVPSKKALDEAGLTGSYETCIEEESRLIFVAITRAKDICYVTYVNGTSKQPKRYGPSIILEPLLKS